MGQNERVTEHRDDVAVEVLGKLLARIDAHNRKGHGPYLVSHAWTDGSSIRIVYSAPPSPRAWGLARDTTESIVDPGPWQDTDEAALYYLLIDFDENQPNTSPGGAADPAAIWWFGQPQPDLPQKLSDLPDAYRYT
ncbi:hypothetical protein CYL16_06830 [Mycobacterium sp. EPG1]|nr:hypothetical protein CYL16_06830 [Mycobacterium sp. EPG1]